MSAHRTELFSDAVLAIALTLLVLDLSIRTFQASRLQSTLLHLWPTYVAFIAAFFYVSVMWINHHFAFARLNSVDKPVMWANIAILCGAVVLPFPTSLVALAFEQGTQTDQRVAVVLYALLAALMTLSWAIFFVVVARRPHLWKHEDSVHVWKHEIRRSTAGAVGYALTAIIGFFVPEVGLALFLFFPIYYAFA